MLLARSSNSLTGQLSMSDKYDSGNDRTQGISDSMKLHIQGVWQNAREIY